MHTFSAHTSKNILEFFIRYKNSKREPVSVFYHSKVYIKKISDACLKIFIFIDKMKIRDFPSFKSTIIMKMFFEFLWIKFL